MNSLATPISHLFQEQGFDQKVLEQSYCLECRDRSYKSNAQRQYLFHSDMDINLPWDDENREFVLDRMLVKKELKLISFHMSANCKKPLLRNRMYEPNGKIYSKEEMLEALSENIQWLRKQIEGRDIEIALENTNYYPTQAYADITDVDFLNSAVRDNNVRFLFDLAHAKVTCHNKGIDYVEYRDSLPLDKAIQLHVCKHGIGEGNMAFDMHDAPDKEIYGEVKMLKEKYPVEYITIEFYKNEDRLIDVLKEYQAI